MSAFSDWNGPGCCGNGGGLPQVTSLEKLVLAVGQLQTTIEGVKDDLHDHEVAVFSATLHKPLQDDYIAKIDAAKQSLQDSTTLLFTLKDALNQAKAYADTLDTTQKTAFEAGDVTTLATAKTYTDTVVGVGVGKIPAGTSVWTYIAQQLLPIQTALTKLATEVKTGTLTVDTINAVSTIITFDAVFDCIYEVYGFLRPRKYIDFKNMDRFSAQIVPIGNHQNSKMPVAQTALLGVLSIDWAASGTREPNPGPLDRAQMYKAARAYIKFPNSRPWNAIVDMVATCSNNQNEGALKNWTGTIWAQCAKTKNRNALVFGLYKGTAADSKVRIYLGVSGEDISDINWNGFDGAHIASQVFHVGGINFIPLRSTDYSNSSVDEISAVQFVGDAEHVIDDLVVNDELWVDNIHDLKGHDVLITSEKDGTLTLGDPDADEVKQLNINSKDRPKVNIASGQAMQEQRMAFLSDLVQSMYFQRSVSVIVDDASDLANLTVWVDDSVPTALKIVGPGYTGPTPHEYPGIYFTDPSAVSGNTTVAGMLFGLNLDGTTKAIKDVALVKKDSTEKVADGRYNGVLLASGTSSVPMSALTGMDVIAAGTIGIPGGTTVIDDAGVYGKVTVINTTTGYCTIETITATALFPYTTPACYEFTMPNTWALSSSIAVPKTFDGLLHDVTFQWAGNIAAQNRVPITDYYVPSYVTWTSPHEDKVVYPAFDGDPWAHIDIPLAGYRGVDRQDEVDTAIFDIAQTQSDYAEREPTMPYTIPERSEEIIANPAYIHHKPITGVAVFDGGTFTAPRFYHGWLVDGGNFTGMAGSPVPSPVPHVPSNNQYRNVIMRLWRGNYTDMPELNAIAAIAQAAWNNLDFTLRWCQSVQANGTVLPKGGELWFADSVEHAGNPGVVDAGLYRFVPVTAWTQSIILHDLHVVGALASPSFVYNAAGTDLTVPGAPAYLTITLTHTSDKGPLGVTFGDSAQSDEPNTLQFDNTVAAPLTSFINISSPRIARLEANAVWRNNQPAFELTDFAVSSGSITEVAITFNRNDPVVDHTAPSYVVPANKAIGFNCDDAIIQFAVSGNNITISAGQFIVDLAADVAALKALTTDPGRLGATTLATQIANAITAALGTGGAIQAAIANAITAALGTGGVIKDVIDDAIATQVLNPYSGLLIAGESINAPAGIGPTYQLQYNPSGSPNQVGWI